VMHRIGRYIVLCLAMLSLPLSGMAAEPTVSPDGFSDCGVAVPIGQLRGYVCTVDGEGRDVVLAQMMDCRGGYGVLQVDAETGASSFAPNPFPMPRWDAQYSSLLSKKNKYYTQFADHFLEYDPVKKKFTACYKTHPQMAMSMYESPSGVIWAASWPDCGLVSYDPARKKFTDYGSLNQENWQQYPESMIGEGDGWIYIGLGSTRGQMIAFNPATRECVKLVPDNKRRNPSMGEVRRYGDGLIRGRLTRRGNADPKKETYGEWYVLHDGKTMPGKEPEAAPVNESITGNTWLRHNDFPSGRKLKKFDVGERELVFYNPTDGKDRIVKFDYPTEGAHVLGVIAGSDGRLYVPSMWPWLLAGIDPKNLGDRSLMPTYQDNIMLADGDNLYIGGYAGGYVADFQPGKPLHENKSGKPNVKLDNPICYGKATPIVHRPHTLAVTPDGKTLIMGGTPGYGLTGGGLALVDTTTGNLQTIPATELIRDEACFSLVALSNELLLVGTTVEAGTGGEVKAKDCTLYIYDLPQRKIIWREKPFPGKAQISGMVRLPDGKVLGVANLRELFRFDPETKKIVARNNFEKYGVAADAMGQGPRILFRDAAGNYYLLLKTGVAKVNPSNCEIIGFVKSPVEIGNGGAIIDDTLYFVTGSHLWNFDLKKLAQAKTNK
ncbi:MAG: hypothetical protein PHQ27_08915, partial [Victivallales bacterium]|nr:hypothetical protein [Victivallales bacterium]